MGRVRRSYSGIASTTSTSFFFLFPPFQASTSAFFFASASAAGAAFLGPIAPVIRMLRACWISFAFDWPNVKDEGSFAARIMRSKSWSTSNLAVRHTQRGTLGEAYSERHAP